MRFSINLTLSLSAFLAVLFMSAPAYAEKKLASSANFPKIQDTIEIAGFVQLRSSSPDPTFGVKGSQLGWIKAGEKLKVLGVKSYISVHGSEIWLEVQKLENTAVSGWIFAGLASEISKGKSVVNTVVSPDAKAASEAEARAAKASADAMANTDSLIRDEF
jgi:hypothetical protein